MQRTLRASQIILTNLPSFFCGSDKLQRRAYLSQHLPDEKGESWAVRACLVDLCCLRCSTFKPIGVPYVNFGLSCMCLYCKWVMDVLTWSFHNCSSQVSQNNPIFITCRMRSIAEDVRRWIAAEERRVDLLRCSEETLNMSVQSEDSATPWKEYCRA